MNSKAKPFVKWVGGKGRLIEQLEQSFRLTLIIGKMRHTSNHSFKVVLCCFTCYNQHPNIQTCSDQRHQFGLDYLLPNST